MMRRGRAVGGPRDGIVLEAPETWIGTVFTKVRRHSIGRAACRMYPGRYVWQDGRWVWTTE